MPVSGGSFVIDTVYVYDHQIWVTIMMHLGITYHQGNKEAYKISKHKSMLKKLSFKMIFNLKTWDFRFFVCNIINHLYLFHWIHYILNPPISSTLFIYHFSLLKIIPMLQAIYLQCSIKGKFLASYYNSGLPLQKDL